MKIASCVCVSAMSVLLLPAANTSTPFALPHEIGMYARDRDGAWQGIEPEFVDWKTGGVLKSVFSSGIIRPDVNARVREKSAATDAAFPDEFLVVVPDSVSITDFQMLQLHKHARSREFRVITGGVFHQSGGAERDEQGFSYLRIAPRTYLVSFQRYEGGGEYGFLPPQTFSKTPVYIGKIYCFRMRN